MTPDDPNVGRIVRSTEEMETALFIAKTLTTAAFKFGETVRGPVQPQSMFKGPLLPIPTYQEPVMPQNNFGGQSFGKNRGGPGQGSGNNRGGSGQGYGNNRGGSGQAYGSHLGGSLNESQGGYGQGFGRSSGNGAAAAAGYDAGYDNSAEYGNNFGYGTSPGVGGYNDYYAAPELVSYPEMSQYPAASSYGQQGGGFNRNGQNNPQKRASNFGPGQGAKKSRWGDVGASWENY